MKMKKIVTAFVSCLLLAGIAGTEATSAGGPGIAMRPADFRMLSPSAFWPSAGCPDIAHTKTFQSGGLGYVDTPEFSEAVRAVATGASEYSPRQVPADWRVAAENWIEYARQTPDGEDNPRSGNALFQLHSGEELLFPKGKYACNPDLVSVASLEYMKTQGRKDLTPVSPRVVNAATREIEEIIAAKRQMARRLSVRAAAIATMIEAAGRKNAGNCSPGEAARAKAELERAFIEARTVRSTPLETVAAFDLAERYAGYITEPRVFASSGGGVCQ